MSMQRSVTGHRSACDAQRAPCEGFPGVWQAVSQSGRGCRVVANGCEVGLPLLRQGWALMDSRGPPRDLNAGSG